MLPRNWFLEDKNTMNPPLHFNLIKFFQIEARMS